MGTHNCDCGAHLTVVPEQSRRSPYSYDAPAAVVCRDCAAYWKVIVTPSPGVALQESRVQFVRDGNDARQYAFLEKLRELPGWPTARDACNACNACDPMNPGDVGEPHTCELRST